MNTTDMPRSASRFLFATLMVVISAVSAGPVVAEEIQVQAQITRVTPITEASEASEALCDVPPPERDQGFAAMLRWDLQGRCRPVNVSADEALITGYKVDYLWDGRELSAVVPELPEGDTLALRIRLD